MRAQWKHIGNVSGIYSITNLINGKMYVGLAVDMNSRCVTHYSSLINNNHDNQHLQKSWNKYGTDAFRFEEIERCNEEFLYSNENYWCYWLDVHNPEKGYNIANTGQSRSTRMKKSSIDKRQIKRKENAENRGYWVHPDRIEKMKQELKGKPVHPKMLENSIKSSSKKTYQYDLYGNLIAIYSSQNEAERVTGINSKNINAACKGKITKSNGYVWRYENCAFNSSQVLLEKPLPNNTKGVIQYTVDGQKIRTYDSIRQAIKNTGICGETIRNGCNKLNKTNNKNTKYKWEWKN